MGSQRTKEDDVQRISTSVFVTNFPEYACAKDLWNACKQYGYVVDAFIPNRRSKAGKKFGFVRFIKVFDVERLVNNLCTVWIGRHRIHANVAKFHRPTGLNRSKLSNQNGEYRDTSNGVKQDSGNRDNTKSYAYAVKGRAQENGERDTNPVLVLDDSCVNKQDYSCCLNGKIKEFGALANLKVVLENEGFTDIDLRYLGGLWVMIVFKSVEVKNKFSSCAGSGSWFSQLIQASSDFIIDGRVTWVEIEGVPLKVWNENTFKRIVSKWGTLLTVENSEEDHLHSKRLCVYMKGMSNIFESFKITYQGKAYWVCAKEIPGWTPDFDEHNDEDSDSDDEQFEGVFKEDIGGCDEEVQGENDVSVVPDTVVEETNPKSIDGDGFSDQIGKQSADPFNIYSLLNKNKLKENKESNTNESLKYLPGFTPSEDVEANGQMDNQRMSFDCEKSDSVGNSGGILCVWDPNSFKKLNTTISDYFVMIRGNWVNNGKLLLIISVYAPQEFSEKKLLWDYLGQVIANWKGEVIIMGDFNEVRNKNERFGSIFHVQGANAFNTFISMANLEEIPLGGCSFTWCHRSASKMSKLDRFLMSESLLRECPNFSAITLDRYLSDHRPILLRESAHDYGPIPFWFFHYWLEVEGFENFVNEVWHEAPVVMSNAMINLMNKLKYLKKKIRVWNGMRL
ncbi:RNA-directed DNA polymerase, eukaryota [Tanacetum coccineum]